MLLPPFRKKSGYLSLLYAENDLILHLFIFWETALSFKALFLHIFKNLNVTQMS